MKRKEELIDILKFYFNKISIFYRHLFSTFDIKRGFEKFRKKIQKAFRKNNSEVRTAAESNYASKNHKLLHPQIGFSS